MKVLSEKIKAFDKEQKELSSALKKALLEIPNIPHSSCPEGVNEKDNIVVSENKNTRDFNFPLKDHIELGEKLDLSLIHI